MNCVFKSRHNLIRLLEALMHKENRKKSEVIREVGKEYYSQSNNWIVNYIAQKYKVKVSVQSVAQILGRYKDRKNINMNNADNKARTFLLSCNNDYLLAKKILANNGGIL